MVSPWLPSINRNSSASAQHCVSPSSLWEPAHCLNLCTHSQPGSEINVLLKFPSPFTSADLLAPTASPSSEEHKAFGQRKEKQPPHVTHPQKISHQQQRISVLCTLIMFPPACIPFAHTFLAILAHGFELLPKRREAGFAPLYKDTSACIWKDKGYTWYNRTRLGRKVSYFHMWEILELKAQWWPLPILWPCKSGAWDRKLTQLAKEQVSQSL